MEPHSIQSLLLIQGTNSVTLSEIKIGVQHETLKCKGRNGRKSLKICSHFYYTDLMIAENRDNGVGGQSHLANLGLKVGCTPGLSQQKVATLAPSKVMRNE